MAFLALIWLALFTACGSEERSRTLDRFVVVERNSTDDRRNGVAVVEDRYDGRCWAIMDRGNSAAVVFGPVPCFK